MVDRDRTLGIVDQGVDGIGLGLAEPQLELAFEVAQWRPALDRAAGGERDQQRLGAGGIAFGRGGLEIEPGQPLFERGDPLVHPTGRSGERGAGAGRG